MASPSSALQPQKVKHEKRSWQFRDHSFTAYVRPVAGMDEEAAILSKGMDVDQKRVMHHAALLEEYCRRCVRDLRIQGPNESADEVEPITGHELGDAIQDSIRRDADYCWSLYINLGASDVANIGSRASLVEAVQGKRTGSSTPKTGTPTTTPSLKPSSSESFSGEEE